MHRDALWDGWLETTAQTVALELADRRLLSVWALGGFLQFCSPSVVRLAAHSQQVPLRSYLLRLPSMLVPKKNRLAVYSFLFKGQQQTQQPASSSSRRREEGKERCAKGNG